MAGLVAFYGTEPIDSIDPKTLTVEQLPVSGRADFEIPFAETGVVYVRHPMRPSRLIPLGSYHAQILYEKTNDAIAMLTALGASKIDLSHSTNVSKEARADIEAMFGIFAPGGGTGFMRSENARVVFRSQGEGAAPRPIPALTWIDEPGWRGVIDGRLNTNLTSFSLVFTYDQHSGVDAELVARVKKFGLRAGGRFHHAHKVAFQLEGEFPPLSRRGLMR